MAHMGLSQCSDFRKPAIYGAAGALGFGVQGSGRRAKLLTPSPSRNKSASPFRRSLQF